MEEVAVEMGFGELIKRALKELSSLASDLQHATWDEKVISKQSACRHSLREATEDLELCLSFLTSSSNATKPKRPKAPKRRRPNVDSSTIITDKTRAYHDGYQWRKYGNKNIMGSKYSREYYRCAHRDYGCPALKQVQELESDRRQLYLLTCTGKHTCKDDHHFMAFPSSKKQRLSKNNAKQQQQPLNSSNSESDDDSSPSVTSKLPNRIALGTMDGMPLPLPLSLCDTANSSSCTRLSPQLPYVAASGAAPEEQQPVLPPMNFVVPEPLTIESLKEYLLSDG